MSGGTTQHAARLWNESECVGGGRWLAFDPERRARPDRAATRSGSRERVGMVAAVKPRDREILLLSGH
jgi:hypothetical protein